MKVHLKEWLEGMQPLEKKGGIMLSLNMPGYGNSGKKSRDQSVPVVQRTINREFD